MQTDDLPVTYRQIFGKLKDQIDAAQHRGLKAKSPAFIEEFAYNYLRSLSILSQIRSNPNWLKYGPPCQKLLIQANVLLYPEPQTRLKTLLYDLWVTLPARLWQCRYYHLASFVILLTTMAIGFLIVRQNFEMASVFIPTGLRSSHELEAYLLSSGAQHKMLTAGRDAGNADKTFFTFALMVNNIMVAIRCFIGGFLYGIPSLLILIMTGLMLGTFPALFYGGDLYGLGAWLLPHGVPEISAIILAGGAGLKLGLTMLNPGDNTMGNAVKHTLKALIGTVLIFGVLLVWAAIVESFVRQSDMSNDSRYLVAAISVFPISLLFIRGYYAEKVMNQKQPDSVSS